MTRGKMINAEVINDSKSLSPNIYISPSVKQASQLVIPAEGRAEPFMLKTEVSGRDWYRGWF